MKNDSIATFCPKCGHSEGWGDLYRGPGCNKTVADGPCNSDYENCGCRDDFHSPSRCTERKETLTVTEINDRRKRYPFLLDGRCGLPSYASAGPCEDHIDAKEKKRVDDAREASYQRYTERRNREILEQKIKDAKEFLREHA